MEYKKNKFNSLIIATDGACRNNGKQHAKGSFAYEIYDNDDENEKSIFKYNKYLGKTTNNRAEYTAIVEALKKARTLTNKKVELFSDSNLAISQINGDWLAKNERLIELLDKVNNAKRNFKECIFYHVSREHKFIKNVDKLANLCLDQYMVKKGKYDK